MKHRQYRAPRRPKRDRLLLAVYDDANSPAREGWTRLFYDTPLGLLMLEWHRARWWETWLEPPIRVGWKEDAK